MAAKKDFTPAEKKLVWDRARQIDSVDPDTMRQDYAGAWIRFVDYGNRNSQYGWEIDHLKPLAQGGAMSDGLTLRSSRRVKPLVNDTMASIILMTSR